MESRRSATRAREPDEAGFVARGGVRVAYESFGAGEHDDPVPAELDARPRSANGRRRCRTSPAIVASSRSTRAATAARTGPERSSRLRGTRSRGRRPGRARCPWHRPGGARLASRVARCRLSSSLQITRDALPPRPSSGPSFPLATAPRGDRSTSMRSCPSTRAGSATTAMPGGATSPASASGSSARYSPSRTRPGRSSPASNGRRATDRGAAGGKEVDSPKLGEAQTRAMARRVRCPVLVIHGDDDRICLHADGVELASETGGRLVTLEGSGHSPTRETRCASTCFCANSYCRRHRLRPGGGRPCGRRAPCSSPRQSASGTPAATWRSRGNCAACDPASRSNGSRSRR